MTDPDPSLLLSFRANLRACTSCAISSNTGGPIPWSGDIHPRYAILGEAPGKTEALRGEPFVGDSGAILRHWLKEVGIDPREVAYLNSVACFPGRNPATPTSTEMSNCRPWMHGQLEFIRPEILITLGTTAFSQLWHPHVRPKLLALHGKPLYHPLYHFHVWSTYHPAAYLRGRSKKYEKLITEDLAALASWNGHALDVCYLCGDELYSYDERGIGYCTRHATIQGALFPEDMGVTT